ncbi:MAG: adenine phosphoribosyltransferase [Actinomycetota bacterium]
MDLKKIIRNIPDFPKKGVVFRDITPLLKDGKAFKYSVDLMADHYKGVNIDSVLGAEARGFIFGAAMAYRLEVGFVPVRKPGKLPYDICSVSYSLEYGKNILEMHTDAIRRGENILIVDDLVATGGTAKAKADLVEQRGGNVLGFCFLIELNFLNPRKLLQGYDVFSLIEYETE